MAPGDPEKLSAISCTDVHIFPQCFCGRPLANISGHSYDAHRLIGKRNFTSQFRSGGKGKTEQAFRVEVRSGNFAVQAAGDVRVKPRASEVWSTRYNFRVLEEESRG